MTATTVYSARRIHTMNPAQPTATHEAVRDGPILAVGDQARVAAWGRSLWTIALPTRCCCPASSKATAT